jgi:lipopolysaccharide/colanic/teichoic acid biosynthesis glycosyltransferase
MKRQLVAEAAGAWVPSIALTLLVWMAVSYRLRLYRVPVVISLWSLLWWAAKNTAAIFCVTVLATFFSWQFGPGASRIFVLCLLPATFVMLSATRGTLLGLAAVVERGQEAPRIVMIGEVGEAKQLIDSLEHGIAKAIRGVIVPQAALTPIDNSLKALILGNTKQFAELVNREQIDHAILLNRSLPAAELEHCKEVFSRMGIPVSYSLDLPLEFKRPGDEVWPRSRIQLSKRYGLATVDLPPVLYTKAQDVIKRAMDLALASALLVILGPLMAIAALAVKLTSKGPVLARSLHVGKGGRHFNCVRFRTTATDPLVLTRVGRLLVKYRFDELPQLLNILRGKMSFVGPAPLLVSVIEGGRISSPEKSWVKVRTLALPGLTGLWQMSHSTMSFEEMLQLDLAYIRTRSISLDIGILLGTPWSVMRGIRVPEYPEPKLAFMVADAS